MIHVTAGTRLHFGFFSVPGMGTKEEKERQFGGVGLMLQEPALQVQARIAETWSATGLLAERALSFAQQLVTSWPGEKSSFHLHVETCPPEHMGLGTGTQLALAVGWAVARAAGRKDIETLELARQLGRGRRSALGIHGFIHGGFLVEGGKGPLTQISPLLMQTAFPESWRILLIVPAQTRGLHGQSELHAFVQLKREPTTSCDILCRLTLLGMLPALKEQDFPAFGEALFEFNYRVGEMFRPAQGGIYTHRLTEELIRFLRGQGIRGTGQSSWGPTVFAVVAEDQVDSLIHELHQHFSLMENEIIHTGARNQGAEVSGEWGVKTN